MDREIRTGELGGSSAPDPAAMPGRRSRDGKTSEKKQQRSVQGESRIGGVEVRQDGVRSGGTVRPEPDKAMKRPVAGRGDGCVRGETEAQGNTDRHHLTAREDRPGYVGNDSLEGGLAKAGLLPNARIRLSGAEHR